MSQLVGSDCAICNSRIASVLEGKHCESCHSPIHLKCGRSNDNKENPNNCSVCGASAEIVKKSRSEFLRSQRESSQSVPLMSRLDSVDSKSILNYYWMFRWLVSCVILLVFGAFLTLVPPFPDDGSKITIMDRAIGLAMIGVGIICGFLVAYRVRRQSTLGRSNPNTHPD
jgi:hypothetical protein